MPSSTSDAKRAVDPWYLGKTSSKYETGGRGAITISTGKSDHGGVSYGAYQLSSHSGTLHEYLSQSLYRGQFSGLSPATSQFNSKWRELAATEPGFAREQHDFIRRTHYDVQVERLQSIGIDLSARGRAVQDALWSTSVQLRGLTRTIVSKGIEEKFGSTYELSRLSDRDVVEAIQDYKIAHNNTLFRSSPGSWDGLLRRAREEKAELAQLATYDSMLAGGSSVPADILRPGHEAPRHTHTAHVASTLHRAPSTSHRNDPASASFVAPNLDDATVKVLQRDLNQLGMKGADGRPLEVDGNYGKHTRHAVAHFQREHALPATGLANNETLSEINAYAIVAELKQRKAERETLALTHAQTPAHDLRAFDSASVTDDAAAPALDPLRRETATRHAVQHPTMQHPGMTGMDAERETYAPQRHPVVDMPAPAPHRAADTPDHTMPGQRLTPPAPTATWDAALTPFSDPAHPEHDLYLDIQARLAAKGQHFPEDRLTQITAAVHNDRTKAGWDGRIDVKDDKVYVQDYRNWASVGVIVPLDTPAPSIQASMQDVQQQDQIKLERHQAFVEQQQQARAQGPQGPVMR